MDRVIYKTQPRLFIFSMTFLGFGFFGFLFLMTLQSVQDDYNLLILTILAIFAILSLKLLFYFLTIKTIKLTRENIIISHLFLPINRTINLKEVRNIKQTTKEAEGRYYIFTEITTLIYLVDNTLIKLFTIGEIDFDGLYKTFTKLKRGEGKIKDQKQSFLLYLIDNLDGFLWIILLLILTTGLGYEIFTK